MTSDVNIPKAITDIAGAIGSASVDNYNADKEKTDAIEMIDNGSTVRKALSLGVDRQTVANKFAERKGIDPYEADMRVVEFATEPVRELRDRGAPDDMLLDLMKSANYDPSLHDVLLKKSALPRSYRKKHEDIFSQQVEAKELYTSYNNVYNKYSTNYASASGMLISSDMASDAAKDLKQLEADIVNRLIEEGHDAGISDYSGEIVIRDKEGREVSVTPDFLDGIAASQHEIALGIYGGAFVGPAIGAVLTGGNPLGIAAGAMLGGGTGASLGRSADLYINSLKLKEELEAGLMRNEMVEAGIHDATMGVITGASTKYLVVPATKVVYKAFQYFTTGADAKALQYLKKSFNLTDTQVTKIRNEWLDTLERAPTRKKFISFKGINKSVPLTKTQLSNRALLETTEGAENIIKEAIGTDLSISNRILTDINIRAKGLVDEVNKLNDPDLGARLREDFASYTDDVDKFYGTVSKTGADIVDGTDYSFSIDRLGIRPILDSIPNKIENPEAKLKLVNILSKIDARTDNREFSGLLDLYKEINKFKYDNYNNLSKDTRDTINSVLHGKKGINKEIQDVAIKYMGKKEGKAWYDNLRLARLEYNKMRTLQDTVIYKSLVKNVKTEESLQNALIKWSPNKEMNAEQLNRVMSKVSPYVRSKTEVAIIKNIVNENTLGQTYGRNQAVDFLDIHEKLQGYNIVGKEGKFLKSKIDEMAKVYKIDRDLGSIVGRLRKPSASSYLTDNPVIAVKRNVFNRTMDYVSALLPTESGRLNSLYKTLPKIFEEPLNYKKTQEFIGMFPKDRQDEMRSLVKSLQVEEAKRLANSPKKPESFIRVYQPSKDGNHKVTTGKWGKGQYYTPKVFNKKSGEKVVGKEINLDQLATFEDMSRVLSMPVSPENLSRIRNMRGFQSRLKKAGFLGVKDGERYMIFPEVD